MNFLRDLPRRLEYGPAALTGISAFPDRLMYRKIQSILEPLLTPTAMNVLFQSSDAMATFVTRLKESLSDQFRMEFIVDVHMERFNRLRLDMSSLGKKQEERKEERRRFTTKERPIRLEEIKSSVHVLILCEQAVRRLRRRLGKFSFNRPGIGLSRAPHLRRSRSAFAGRKYVLFPRETSVV
jgi:hypothetical protein